MYAVPLHNLHTNYMTPYHKREWETPESERGSERMTRGSQPRYPDNSQPRPSSLTSSWLLQILNTPRVQFIAINTYHKNLTLPWFLLCSYPMILTNKNIYNHYRNIRSHKYIQIKQHVWVKWIWRIYIRWLWMKTLTR